MKPVEWGVFASLAPELAAIGRERLAGRVAYLATSRRSDGAPRVHPVTPDLSPGRLFLFMEPTSPKGHDLRADPRFALHCGVEDNSGGRGEFYVSGEAIYVTDPALRKEAIASSPFAPADRYILFHLLVAQATSRRYVAGTPISETWRSD
jgi:hypothetical protein